MVNHAPMNESATPPKNIVLIGFMGSGKSTVGRELHHRLGYPLVDMDQVIEQRAGKSIAAIHLPLESIADNINKLLVESVGELPLLYISLSCKCPPATNLAFNLSKVPSGENFSFKPERPPNGLEALCP